MKRRKQSISKSAPGAAHLSLQSKYTEVSSLLLSLEFSNKQHVRIHLVFLTKTLCVSPKPNNQLSV